MVEVGDTVIDEPLIPLLHWYVLAPLAEMVVLWSTQIDGGTAVIVILGKGFITIVWVSLSDNKP